MLDGIGKDICLSLAILLGVLLATKHDGFSTIDFVDSVNDCIQSLHFLKLFGIIVKNDYPQPADRFLL